MDARGGGDRGGGGKWEEEEMLGPGSAIDCLCLLPKEIGRLVKRRYLPGNEHPMLTLVLTPTTPIPTGSNCYCKKSMHADC